MNTVSLMGTIYGHTNLVGEGNSVRLVITKEDGTNMSPQISVRKKFGKKGEDGKYQYDYIAISAFGQNAEAIHKYLAPNGRVAIEGYLQTYKGQNGYGMSVSVEKVDIIDFKNQNTAPTPQPTQQASAPAPAPAQTQNPFDGFMDASNFEDPFA